MSWTTESVLEVLEAPFNDLLFRAHKVHRENFDPNEGFVISRVNGQWDVQSILKLCPMGEEEALLIFARLLERKVIAMQP